MKHLCLCSIKVLLAKICPVRLYRIKQLAYDLCNPVEVPFAGRSSFVPNEADSYLRAIYGDYMQIPPVEKQERNCYLKFDLGENRRKGGN